MAEQRDEYARMGADSGTDGLYVRFDPGFGLNVYVGHRRGGRDDSHELSLSIGGWERLGEFVDEWRARQMPAVTRPSITTGEDHA